MDVCMGGCIKTWYWICLQYIGYIAVSADFRCLWACLWKDQKYEIYSCIWIPYLQTDKTRVLRYKYLQTDRTLRRYKYIYRQTGLYWDTNISTDRQDSYTQIQIYRQTGPRNLRPSCMDSYIYIHEYTIPWKQLYARNEDVGMDMLIKHGVTVWVISIRAC